MPLKGSKKQDGGNADGGSKMVWNTKEKSYETFFHNEETKRDSVYYIPYSRFGNTLTLAQANAIFGGPKQDSGKILTLKNEDGEITGEYPIFFPARRSGVLGECDASNVTVGATQTQTSRPTPVVAKVKSKVSI